MKKKATVKSRFKIGPVGEAILVSIAGVGVISLLLLFPGLATLVGPFVKKKKYEQKQIIERNVESLIRLGLVRKSIRNDGEVQLELTKKGKWEAFLRFNSYDTKKKKWDSIWRLVIFDVPISKNKTRKELRKAMRLYGFKMLQQSVWVYPYASDDFIELLKSHLGIGHDVLYMKVSYIENDSQLRKEFDL